MKKRGRVIERPGRVGNREKEQERDGIEEGEIEKETWQGGGNKMEGERHSV